LGRRRYLNLVSGSELEGQVQAGVFALVVVDVDGDFLDQVEGPAVGGFDVLEIGRKDIVALAGGNALGEFAVVVGEEFPADSFGLVGGAANPYGDAVDGVVVGPPDGAEDEAIGFFFFFGVRWGGALQMRRERKEKGCSGEQGRETRGTAAKSAWHNPDLSRLTLQTSGFQSSA